MVNETGFSFPLKYLILSFLGFYWIDPNLGMVDDAVKVYCNMSAGGETCVSPDLHASRMPNIPWRKSTEGWYSTLRGGFRISYDSLGSVQLTFLRLLSKEAYQNFTYTCINSAAWSELDKYPLQIFLPPFY